MSSDKTHGNLIVLSAPSGSGKTSLARGVLEDPAVGRIRFSVSHTTRSPRQGERHGNEYYFVAVEEFEEMLRRGEFLEHARVYGTHYYGTSRGFVERELARGNDVILDIDVQGARKVRRKCPEALLIFVLPPSFQELEKRLRERSLDDEAEIRRRLAIAAQESREYRHYDYLIINDVFEDSIFALKSIVLAARCRTAGQIARGEQICQTFQLGLPIDE